MNECCLITGGAGYLSSTLVPKLLRRGARVNLCGAGGGGFLLVVVPPDRQADFDEGMRGARLNPVVMDRHGSVILHG